MNMNGVAIPLPLFCGLRVKAALRRWIGSLCIQFGVLRLSVRLDWSASCWPGALNWLAKLVVRASQLAWASHKMLKNHGIFLIFEGSKR